MAYNASVISFCFFRRRTVWAAAAAAVTSISLAPVSWAHAQQTAPPPPPTPKAASLLVQATLPSGLHLLFQPRPKGTPLVALAVSVRAGTGQETAQTSGVAHFVEHLVFKGTPNGKPGDLDAQMENLGGELTARTSRDQTLYTVTVPQANWQKALLILGDLVNHPAFRNADLEAERRVILRERAAALTEPVRTGFGQLAGEAYPPQSAYRLPLMGTDESFARLTASDLQTFWQTWYTAPHLTLVVVGDVPPAEVESAANALFPLLPPPSLPPAAPPTVPGADPSLPPLPPLATPLPNTPLALFEGVHRAAGLPPALQPERPLTTVFMGFFIPLRSDDPNADAQKTQAALHVLARWLVRGNGETGRLEKTMLIDRAEAQDVSADFVPGTQGGLLFVSATFAPDEAAQGEVRLADALRRLREDDVLPGDVELAKQTVLGEIRYQNETVEDTAKTLARYEVLHPALLSDAYALLIGQIEVKDVRSVLRLYLTPAHYTVAFVGPTGSGTPTEGETPKP